MTGEWVQLCLPFDFQDEKEPEPDYSEMPHFDNPQNDNERLLQLQYEYRVNGNRKALDSIFLLGLEICKKLVSKETRRNRHIKHLSLEERNEKAMDAVSYVISSYLKKPAWYLRKSFMGYLYMRVVHELYYRRKVDEIVDFVDFSTFYKEGVEDDW